MNEKPVHLCHAHDCQTEVSPSLFMCRPHWYSLSKAMRDAIWREYRPGQEDDKNPSARYMAVQKRAVAEVAFKPRDEASAAIATAYLTESEMWRAWAIERGDGDPLAFCTTPKWGI